MSKDSSIFKAIADPTRRQILQDLQGGEMSAGEIVERFEISGPSISRHLAVLKAADLVTERREGNRILYDLQEERLALAMSDFLSAVCPTQVVMRRKRTAPK
jgi:DNA-binding transcriptional ArsR family regulator